VPSKKRNKNYFLKGGDGAGPSNAWACFRGQITKKRGRNLRVGKSVDWKKPSPGAKAKRKEDRKGKNSQGEEGGEKRGAQKKEQAQTKGKKGRCHENVNNCTDQRCEWDEALQKVRGKGDRWVRRQQEMPFGRKYKKKPGKSPRGSKRKDNKQTEKKKKSRDRRMGGKRIERKSNQEKSSESGSGRGAKDTEPKKTHK